MALWHFTNFNKYGNPRSRIFHRPDGEGFSHGPGFGPTMVRRFKYDYKGEVMPPTLLELNGKTYLMPLWKEVVMGTTLDDTDAQKLVMFNIIKNEMAIALKHRQEKYGHSKS